MDVGDADDGEADGNDGADDIADWFIRYVLAFMFYFLNFMASHIYKALISRKTYLEGTIFGLLFVAVR